MEALYKQIDYLYHAERQADVHTYVYGKTTGTTKPVIHFEGLRGVTTGSTGVDMSTPLLSEGVPGIDAGGSGLKFDWLPYIN